VVAPARGQPRPRRWLPLDFLDLDLHERRERDVRRRRKEKEEIRFDQCERKKREGTKK
jgi:hypothetical protein